MATTPFGDRQGARFVADVAGVLVAGLGAAVLAGWFTHTRGLVQLNPTQTPVQVNTAVCFVLLGVALVARRRAVPVIAAAIVVGIGVVTAAQYALDRSLGIDTLLYDPWITFGTAAPGRMARNTALCFVALGGSAIALAATAARRRRVPPVVGVVASAVAGLVLVALFGYAAGVSEAYTWRSTTAMPPMTAVGLLVAALACGAAAWDSSAPTGGAPRWLPVPVAVGTLAATLFLWQALTGAGAGRAIPLDRAAGVTIGLGVLLAALLRGMTAATQATTAARRASEVRHQRDVALREAYAAVALGEDLETAFESYAKAVTAEVAFDRIALTLLEGDVARIAVALGEGVESVPAGTTMPLTEPILADVLASRSTVVVDDVAARYAGSPAARAGMRSFVATPIVIGGVSRAVLTVSCTAPRAYDDDAVALIDDLTALTGGALYTLASLEGERSTSRRLRELDQLKNEFVGVVAHDLRSPMTVIAGYVDTVLQRWDAVDDATKKDLLAVVSRNTKRLSTMVEDVLQVARIESGDFPYDIRPFDLRALVTRTVGEMNAATPDKRIVATMPESLPEALGDEDRYWRVLTNLLSNAQKFSPADTPVEVLVTPREREIEVAVADRGPGIPEEQLPRLFGKFSRLAGPPDGQKGTGLGLYICKALVEAQNGRIWARSTVRSGTTVTFTVPRTGER